MIYYTYSDDCPIWAPKTQEDLNTPTIYVVSVRGKKSEIKVGCHLGILKRDRRVSNHRLVTFTRAASAGGNDVVMLAHIPIKHVSKQALQEFGSRKAVARHFEKVAQLVSKIGGKISKNSFSEEMHQESFFFDTKEGGAFFNELMEEELTAWGMGKNFKLAKFQTVGLTRTAGDLYFKYNPCVFLLNSMTDELLDRDPRGRKILIPKHLEKFIDQRLVDKNLFRFL